MNTFISREFDSSFMIPESCVAASHVREALTIIDAINAGELLAALPANQGERHRHQTAVSLLAMLEKALRDALCAAPDAAHSCRAANGGPQPQS